MNKWPLKMWLWGKDGIFVASNRPPDPGDDLIAISVYPADQVPEPVARIRNGQIYWQVPYVGDCDLYLAAPSTIRQEERERLADDLLKRGWITSAVAKAIRALTDEEKKG